MNDYSVSIDTVMGLAEDCYQIFEDYLETITHLTDVARSSAGSGKTCSAR